MFEAIKARITKALPQLGRPTLTARDRAPFLSGHHNVLYNKLGSEPTGHETQHWVTKLVNKQKAPAREWLTAKVQAQTRHERGPVPPSTLGPQRKRAQAVEPTAVPTNAQDQIVQAALDDYVKQCKEHPDRKPTGAIANLLDYAKTGGKFSTAKNGFQERLNRIGERTFNNRFEAVDFLVRNGLTREVPERTAKAIMDLHEDLLRTEINHHRHGAGL